MAKRRLNRVEKKAQTREALVRSAATIFARRGFHAASVDEIAENAGFSVGALYSNFGGKEDLLLAVIEEGITDQVRLYAERIREGTTIAEEARNPADAFMARLRTDPEPFLLFIELWTHAVRDPKLRPQLAARSAGVREFFTETLKARAGELELDVPDEAAEELGAVIDALGIGLAVRKLIEPDAVPDDFFGTAISHIVLALLATYQREGRPEQAKPAKSARRRRPRSA